MNTKITVLLFLCLPFVTLAQQKKTSKATSAKTTTNQSQTTKHEAENLMDGFLPLALPGAPLTPFTLVTSNEIRITKEDLLKDKPVLLVLFKPYCEHCEKVGEEIGKKMEMFKDINILFVCDMSFFGDLNNYIAATGLENKENVRVCGAPGEFMKQLFENKGLPQIMIYNREWILQKSFYGKLDLNEALTLLNK